MSNTFEWTIDPTPDLTNQQWRFPEGLEFVGGELDENTVLDYFAASPYFDRHSTNEQLRMQTQFTGQAVQDVANELKRFTGIEFAVIHSERKQAPTSSLFVIQKRYRTGPEEVKPLANYFVINGSIYQAPDVYSVLSNRLLTTVHRLQSSLDLLSKSKPSFDPRSGYEWKIKPPNTTEDTTTNGEENGTKDISQPEEGKTQQEQEQQEQQTKVPISKPHTANLGVNTQALNDAFANTLLTYSSARPQQ